MQPASPFPLTGTEFSSALFLAAGAPLHVSAPAHWAVMSMSLIVGLALGAASVRAVARERIAERQV